MVVALALDMLCADDEGETIPQGLSVGIERDEAKAITSMKKLTQSTINAFVPDLN